MVLAVGPCTDVSAAPALQQSRHFEGRDTVQWEEVVEVLDDLAFALEQVPVLRRDYEALLEEHGLLDTDALFSDYVRVRLAFEATRDGGWWHLRWTITNRAPRSDEIWNQWRDFEVPEDGLPRASADAECDELSALFAVVARDLGVDHIGLFWPVWNHVVAVWTIEQQGRDPVRIVVPTSQIFLDPSATLGTDAFDPWKQKTIYTYRRNDVRARDRISGALARFMVEQVQANAGRSQDEQQGLRNERSRMFGGS